MLLLPFFYSGLSQKVLVTWKTYPVLSAIRVLEERKAGNFDFAREGWIADFNDPINMLEMWTTVSGNNDCQFGR